MCIFLGIEISLVIHVSIKIFPVINMFSAKTSAILFLCDINSRQFNEYRAIDKFRWIVLLSKINMDENSSSVQREILKLFF